jgi:hypothetical protein
MDKFTYLISSIKKVIQIQAKFYESLGYNYTVVDGKQDKRSDLNSNEIQISSAGCETSPFGVKSNIQLRFWHDCVHLRLGTSYSFEDEVLTILEQLDQIHDKTWLSPEAITLLRNDMLGQTLYYNRYNEYVKDQTAFLRSSYRYGLTQTLLKRW